MYAENQKPPLIPLYPKWLLNRCYLDNHTVEW